MERAEGVLEASCVNRNGPTKHTVTWGQAPGHLVPALGLSLRRLPRPAALSQPAVATQGTRLLPKQTPVWASPAHRSLTPRDASPSMASVSGEPGLLPCRSCDMVFRSWTLLDNHARRFCIGRLTGELTLGAQPSAASQDPGAEVRPSSARGPCTEAAGFSAGLLSLHPVPRRCPKNFRASRRPAHLHYGS